MSNRFQPISVAITVAAVLFPIWAGCDRVKKNVARQVIAQAQSAKVNRGFHIVDGEAVLLDSNAGEGRITRKLPDADVATFQALKQPSDARALFALDDNHVFMGELYNVAIINEADPSTFELLTSPQTSVPCERGELRKLKKARNPSAFRGVSWDVTIHEAREEEGVSSEREYPKQVAGSQAAVGEAVA